MLELRILRERLKAMDEPASLKGAAMEVLRSVVSGAFKVTFERHVLGFWHARLDSSDDCDLRLHVWPVPLQPREPHWPIHNHRFTLNSYVLSGTVVNTIYDVEFKSEGTSRAYTVEYVQGKSVRKASEKLLEYSVRTSSVIEEDRFYTVPHMEFHSSAVTFQPSVTIALAYNKRDMEPIVIGDRVGKPEYTYERMPVPDTEVFAILSKVVRSST